MSSKCNVCRICLGTNTEVYSVFEFAAAIMEVAPILIVPGDGYPNVICDDCIEKLQAAQQFRLLCIQSDITLKQQAQQQTNNVQLAAPLKKPEVHEISSDPDVSDFDDNEPEMTRPNYHHFLSDDLLECSPTIVEGNVSLQSNNPPIKSPPTTVYQYSQPPTSGIIRIPLSAVFSLGGNTTNNLVVRAAPSCAPVASVTLVKPLESGSNLSTNTGQVTTTNDTDMQIANTARPTEKTNTETMSSVKISPNVSASQLKPSAISLVDSEKVDLSEKLTSHENLVNNNDTTATITSQSVQNHVELTNHTNGGEINRLTNSPSDQNDIELKDIAIAKSTSVHDSSDRLTTTEKPKLIAKSPRNVPNVQQNPNTRTCHMKLRLIDSKKPKSPCKITANATQNTDKEVNDEVPIESSVDGDCKRLQIDKNTNKSSVTESNKTTVDTAIKRDKIVQSTVVTRSKMNTISAQLKHSNLPSRNSYPITRFTPRILSRQTRNKLLDKSKSPNSAISLSVSPKSINIGKSRRVDGKRVTVKIEPGTVTKNITLRRSR